MKKTMRLSALSSSHNLYPNTILSLDYGSPEPGAAGIEALHVLNVPLATIIFELKVCLVAGPAPVRIALRADQDVFAAAPQPELGL